MSMPEMEASSPRSVGLDLPTSLALLVSLVAYPSLRALELDFYFTGTAWDWWRFMGVMSLGHWICFAVVALALRRSGEDWQSIGVDWSWFRRHRFAVLGFFALLLVGAALVENLGPNSAPRQGLFPLYPSSLAERIFMIFSAVATASVVEETLFRGFAITRLSRILPSAWLALPMSVASFFFIHGTPSDPGRITSLVLAGAEEGQTNRTDSV